MVGRGAARDASPKIFTMYTLQSDLVNGKEHYKSHDGTMAIAYNQEMGIWIVQELEKKVHKFYMQVL